MTFSDENSIVWRVHPARNRRLPTLLAVFAIFVFSVATGFGMKLEYESAGLMAFFFGTVGSLVFFIVVLNRYFFATKFTMDDEGITANYPLSKIRIEWLQVRRFLHDERGGFLSTRANSSFLDLFQGMPLTFSGNATEIVEQIENRIRKEVPAS